MTTNLHISRGTCPGCAGYGTHGDPDDPRARRCRKCDGTGNTPQMERAIQAVMGGNEDARWAVSYGAETPGYVTDFGRQQWERFAR